MDDPEKIDIDTLRKNSESLLCLIECLGTALKPVKSDVSGNMVKIIDAQQKLCPEVELLHEVLAKEIAAGCHKKDPSGSVGTLWLTRGMMFFHRLLQIVLEEKDDPNDSLQGPVSRAYEEILREHHNFVMRGAFSVVSHAAPRRSTLKLRLMENDASKEDALIQELNEFLDAMLPTLEALKKLIANLGLK